MILYNPQTVSRKISLHTTRDILTRNCDLVFNKLQSRRYTNYALLGNSSVIPQCSAAASGSAMRLLGSASAALALGAVSSHKNIFFT